jgi:hypothetical protein
MSKIYVDEILPKENAQISAPNLQLPAGSVIQVVDDYLADDFTLSSSGTYFEVVDVNITPKFATSKMLIFVNLTFYLGTTESLSISIYKDNTNLAPNGDRFAYNQHDASNTHRDSITAFYSETAGSTSARTYKLMVKSSTSGGAATICPANSTCSIAVMEIAQ